MTRLPLPVGTPRICRPFAVPVIRAKGSAGFSPCSLGADRQSREASGYDSAGSLVTHMVRHGTSSFATLLTAWSGNSLDTGARRLKQLRTILKVKQLKSLVPCEQAPRHSVPDPGQLLRGLGILLPGGCHAMLSFGITSKLPTQLCHYPALTDESASTFSTVSGTRLGCLSGSAEEFLAPQDYLRRSLKQHSQKSAEFLCPSFLLASSVYTPADSAARTGSLWPSSIMECPHPG